MNILTYRDMHSFTSALCVDDVTFNENGWAVLLETMGLVACGASTGLTRRVARVQDLKAMPDATGFFDRPNWFQERDVRGQRERMCPSFYSVCDGNVFAISMRPVSLQHAAPCGCTRLAMALRQSSQLCEMYAHAVVR